MDFSAGGRPLQNDADGLIQLEFETIGNTLFLTRLAASAPTLDLLFKGGSEEILN